MSHFFRSLPLVLGSLLLLTACQHPRQASQPDVTKQLDQLSAMLASGHFLRVNCSRTDIPDDATLRRTATELAQKRGWNIGAAEYQQLPAQTQLRYQALMQDTTPLQQKCSALNSKTARFINAAQANSHH